MDEDNNKRCEDVSVYSHRDDSAQSLNNDACEKREAIYRETIRNESMKSKNSRLRYGFMLSCIIGLVGGIALGAGISLGVTYARVAYTGNPKRNIISRTEQVFSITDSSNTSSSAQAYNYSTGYSQIISEIEPSVVGITSVILNNRSIFNRSSEPLGSGIIFHYTGDKVYIVTNNHVIENAVSVKISVMGSTDVSAKLVGKQAEADLAVISVSWEDLEAVGIFNVRTAVFGNSDNMRVGDIVLAIGNALGEGNTATQGIISAVNKKIKIDSKYLSVMQTDAAINPGNSGGPLVNMNGEVIGINTAKLLQSSVEGTGYSITSSSAVPVIQELLNTKVEAKPFLGIQGDDISENPGLSNTLQSGVYIVSVIQDTPAAECGLLRGDIIVGFNGETIINMAQLSQLISECNIGDKVKIDIIRNEKTKLTIDATLADNSASNF